MFIALALITMIGSFTVEIYLPTLNDLACHTCKPISSITFIITIFSMAYGISQLVIGILMDRYGRRSILLIGVILYLIGAILAYAIMTYECILIGRILQGIGVAAVAVAGVAIIQDTTKGYESASKQALLNSIKGFAPAIAPLIGTIIEVTFGFEAVFIYVIIMALFILYGTVFYIKETSKVRVDISRKTIIRNYTMLLKSKSYM